MDSYTAVGKLNKSFGDRGILRYTIYEAYKRDFAKARFVFILLDGIYVPFPIGKKAIQNDKEIKLDFVNSIEEAEEIAGKALFLINDDVSEKVETKDTLVWGYITTYRAFDQDANLLGQISEVQSFPMQEMAILDDNPEKLIPLHDSLIERVDQENKEVHFMIPEGLL